jgi:hypothetical protein
VSSQLHVQGCFTTEEKAPGGWVCPRTSLDILEKGKIPFLCHKWNFRPSIKYMYRWNIVKHNLFNFFYYQDVFLHCFVQRHVSALVMSHLQVDYFFLSKANHTISTAIVIVTSEISYILLRKMWSTWRWLVTRAETHCWKNQLKNTS